MDIWILCKNEGGDLTGIGIETSEAKCLDMAGDGQYIAIPIRFGRLYDDIINAGIVGAVPFSSEALKTLVQQIKDAIININGRLDTLENQMSTVIAQGQALQQAVADLDARVTALEEAAIQQP